MPARCGGKLLVLGNIASGKSGLARRAGLLAEFGRAGGAGALLREVGVASAVAEALRARLLVPQERMRSR